MQTVNPSWAWLVLCVMSPVLASGNALNFDGGNDRVQAVALPPVFAGGTTVPFTVEAWLYRSGAPIFGRVLFAQQSTTNFVAIAEAGTGNIYAYVVANGTNFSWQTTANLPRDAWTHLAVRWSAGTPEILFNGVVQAGMGGGTSSTALNGVMMIGARNDGVQPLSAGAIDELRIWNRVLSDCEIKRARFERPPLNTNGLEVRYDFNQGIAGDNNTGMTTLPDVVGGDQNGNLLNFALIGATSNWVASTLPVSSSSAVLFDKTVLVTGEYGRDDSFTVALDSAPVQDVTFTIAGGDVSEGTFLPTTLTFTAMNWADPQLVLVSPIDDGVVDGDVSYALTVSVDPTSDVAFSCIPPTTITVTNLEDRLFGDGFE